MVEGDRLFVEFAARPTQRYFVYAWMFLEDAAERAHRESNPFKRASQLQRLLGPCAANLRMACEAHFGDLAMVPDQRLMWFVTAARHVGVHKGGDKSFARAVKTAWHWDEKARRGFVQTEVALDLDFAPLKLTAEQKAMAIAFMAQCRNDLFAALHAAAGTVAQWIGEKVDDDFHKLGEGNLGRFLVDIPISSRQEFDKYVRVLKRIPGEGA